MGPYCNFCNTRCFIPLQNLIPSYILKAYKNNNLAATCEKGQEFEKKRIGYCYNDIVKLGSYQNK